MSGHVGSQVERKERADPPKYTVDRETTCPLLLRVFCSTSRHNPMSDYMKGEFKILSISKLIILQSQVNISHLTDNHSSKLNTATLKIWSHVTKTTST